MKYGPNDFMISEVFECKYSGEIKLDNMEVEKFEFLDLDKVKKLLEENKSKFAPWTSEILKWYFKMPSKIEMI